MKMAIAAITKMDEADNIEMAFIIYVMHILLRLIWRECKMGVSGAKTSNQSRGGDIVKSKCV